MRDQLTSGSKGGSKGREYAPRPIVYYSIDRAEEEREGGESRRRGEEGSNKNRQSNRSLDNKRTCVSLHCVALP
jgi:hypothetical protein